MSLSFDPDASLSGKKKTVGKFSWFSLKPIPINATAPSDQGLIVSTARNHNLVPGQRILVVGVDYEVDGLHSVIEYPDESHQDKTFLIDAESDERIVGGSIYIPKKFSIRHPSHLTLKSQIEQKELEMEGLKVMELVAPEAYQVAMNQLRMSIINTISNEALAAQVDAVLNAHMIKNDELSQQLKAMLLTKQVNDEMLARSGELKEDLDPGQMAQVNSVQISIQCREIEMLCNMPEGHMSIAAEVAGGADLIREAHTYVATTVQEALKAEQSENSEDEKPTSDLTRTGKKGSKDKAPVKKSSAKNKNSTELKEQNSETIAATS